MTEDEIRSALKPCPFCGAGETRVFHGSYLVHVVHDCPDGAGTGHVEFSGQSTELAISQWNARAGGEPK